MRRILIINTCDGETEQSGHKVEDGKMLAGCFVVQLREDGVAAKEHCERTFGKEGDSPSEYLHIKELEENVQTEHIVLLQPTITFS